ERVPTGSRRRRSARYRGGVSPLQCVDERVVLDREDDAAENPGDRRDESGAEAGDDVVHGIARPLGAAGGRDEAETDGGADPAEELAERDGEVDVLGVMDDVLVTVTPNEPTVEQLVRAPAEQSCVGRDRC